MVISMNSVEFKHWYITPLIVCILYTIVLLVELFNDKLVDWYKLWWVGIAVGSVILLSTPLVIGFKDKSTDDWWKAMGVGMLAIMVWLFIFWALTSQSHIIH